MFQTPEILARLHSLLDGVAQWGPVAPVALVFAIALVEAIVLPWRYWAKGAWVAAVVLCGAGAITLLPWQAQTSHSVAVDQSAAEAAALRGIGAQLDALSQSLPQLSGEAPADTFDTVDDALASLSAKIAGVNEQVSALKTGAMPRSIDTETAIKIADYLRQYGSYRAVVSCAPSDVEAYSYANQLVGVLRAAGWDSNGPEATANVVEQPAMGISVLIRDPSAPDAAKILLDAFNQFNIPHQPGIAADYAIPDSATVELFVAKKP